MMQPTKFSFEVWLSFFIVSMSLLSLALALRTSQWLGKSLLSKRSTENFNLFIYIYIYIEREREREREVNRERKERYGSNYIHGVCILVCYIIT